MNDTYQRVPFTDVLYFADKKWWDWHKDTPAYKALTCEKATVFTTGNLVDDPEVAMLRVAGTPGLSADADALCTGSNSGHQAINIAVLAGAKRIVLLGYDAQQGPQGQHHFFGEHPDKTQAPYANQIRELKGALPFLKDHGIEVINASAHSAINFFPKMPLHEALQ